MKVGVIVEGGRVGESKSKEEREENESEKGEDEKRTGKEKGRR